MLAEKLNANDICNRRTEIITLITKALESLAEADILLKTITDRGLHFDRNTITSQSMPSHKMQAIETLTKQVDSQIWNRIIELGEFRKLMTINEQRKIADQIETCPPVTIENVTATFASLLANRPNMLQDLVETSFLERSKGYKSNAGNKINKKQVIDGVFDRYGYTNFGWRPCDRLDDITKALALVAGLEKPNILQLLRRDTEYLAFNGAVKYKAFKNGNVHITILDKRLLDKLNDVLAGAMGAKL